jgi:plasmid stabilization system protein ParE
MSHYQFTPQASEDLLDIWSFIASDNLEVLVALRRQYSEPVISLRSLHSRGACGKI